MAFVFGKQSEKNLTGVHPTLQRITRRALELSPIDFKITEGLRTFERQRELFNAGKSKTMNSRHLRGYAVDFAAMPAGVVSWEFKHYRTIADAFKTAAEELNVPIVWGGDWQSFKDGPHIELDRNRYV